MDHSNEFFKPKKNSERQNERKSELEREAKPMQKIFNRICKVVQ